MTKRRQILAGMGIGAIWAILLGWLPGQGPQPFIPLNLALVYAFGPGGLVLLLVIGRLAGRRFFDDEIIDGEAFRPGSAADIDQRVLTNTSEQMLLAVLLWPFVAMQLGSVTVIALGISLGVARVLFWVGYHLSPPMRAVGFAATFYPTVFATIVSLWRLLT